MGHGVRLEYAPDLGSSGLPAEQYLTAGWAQRPHKRRSRWLPGLVEERFCLGGNGGLKGLAGLASNTTSSELPSSSESSATG